MEAKLFDRTDRSEPVRAGIIGTGQYATAIVTQSRSIDRLEVLALADLDIEAAHAAFRQAGFDAQDVSVCQDTAEARHAIAQGRRVVLTDGLTLTGLPLNVVIESTGVPEAGAKHALAAIQRGEHVVMVNKETDVVVGPILKTLADEAGVVYTAADGDQPSPLIGLIYWARELGLEVLCGGKSYDRELVFDAAGGTVSDGQATWRLDKSEALCFEPLQPSRKEDCLTQRRSAVGEIERTAGALAEMTIVANATGLVPDVPRLHGPVLRTIEIPQALCPGDEGGILEHRGVIEAVTTLRAPHEPGLGGGVFVVVTCATDYSRRILTTKGLLSNQRGTAMLIYRPYHLCGVETPISILCAALLGVPTGGMALHQHFDVVGRATRDLAPGHVIADDNLQAMVLPARPVTGDAPVPYFMALGNQVATDVTAGEVLTANTVAPPMDSTLWTLRSRQDAQL